MLTRKSSPIDKSFELFLTQLAIRWLRKEPKEYNVGSDAN